MNRIIEILMRRDGITKSEARRSVKETIQMMEDVEYSPMESEEILMDMLGLEPDYIVDILLA